MTIHHGGESGKIHTVQAERDLEANWEVDLARKLEDYLLKICSGEVSGAVDDEGLNNVNFAEGSSLKAKLFLSFSNERTIGFFPKQLFSCCLFPDSLDL